MFLQLTKKEGGNATINAAHIVEAKEVTINRQSDGTVLRMAVGPPLTVREELAVINVMVKAEASSG